MWEGVDDEVGVGRVNAVGTGIPLGCLLHFARVLLQPSVCPAALSEGLLVGKGRLGLAATRQAHRQVDRHTYINKTDRSGKSRPCVERN